jgi:hypothetical protein
VIGDNILIIDKRDQNQILFMGSKLPLYLSFALLVLLIPLTVSAQTQCLTNADTDCDGSIDVSELNVHINAWYACSSCVPDIFNALQGYFSIPFCGDWSCDAAIGEDCGSCQQDCGSCTSPGPAFPQDYKAYWKFDGNADDETHMNNGTLSGSPQFVSSPLGQALDFNGAGDHVIVTNPLWSFNALTISAWIRPVASPSGIDSITTASGGVFSMTFRVRWDQNSIQFLYGDGTNTDYARKYITPPTDAWTHLLMTYDAGTTKVYMNGFLNTTDSRSNYNSTTQGNVQIGSYWEGQIDELLVYGRALNATEVQQIYGAQGGILPCADDPGCSSAGSFCSGSVPYTCTMNATDGCLDRTDGAACLPGDKCASGYCVPDVCSGLGACNDYNDSLSCGLDSCNISQFGCTWNSGSGACEPIPDPCTTVTQCSDYANQASCGLDGCGVPGSCVWNGSGCEKHVVQYANWTAPIGIPYPDFGIAETVDMYIGQQYTFTDSRGTTAYPISSVTGKPYTHYVDNSGACNNNNVGGYGDENNPICTIPNPLDAGSVVEIHGGPYNGGGGGWLRMYGDGTATKPVFIRGYSGTSRPVFSGWGNGLRVGGRYMIIENLAVECGSFVFHTNYPADHDHVSIRNNEIYGRCDLLYGRPRGGGVSVGNIAYTAPAHDIVIYNNYIHDTGDVKHDTDTPAGGVGIAINSNSNHIWVVDNRGHGTGSDSFHAGHGAVNLHHVYVGRNDWHHDKENAIDFKAVQDFIISQNKIYGYRPSCSSNADALRVNDEGGQQRIWILFNEIYDSDVGYAPYSSPGAPHAIGNIIYDTKTAMTFGSTNVINNLVIDTDKGIEGEGWAARQTFSKINNNIISNAKTYHIDGGLSASNNLLWNNGQPVNVIGGMNGITCQNCITDDPLVMNMPEYCERVTYFQYNRPDSMLTKTASGTEITVAGADFAGMGIEYEDRISVEKVPEVDVALCANGCLTAGSSTRPYCQWQRVQSVSGDTITLKRDIACPNTTSVNGVNIDIWFYPDNNQNELMIDQGLGFQAGDNIEFNYDGVARTISSITPSYTQDPAGNVKDRIVFSPPISGKIDGELSICNWRSNTNFVRDFRLDPNNPAIDQGILEGVYDLFNSTYYSDFASYNSIGQLDIFKDFYGTSRPQGSGWDIGAQEQ